MKVQLTKSFGIAPSSLQMIFKEQEAMELKSEKLRESAKRRKTLPYDELGKIQFEWFLQSHSCNVLINGTIVKEKELEISSHLGLKDFLASKRWIDKFKNRKRTLCRL